MKFGKQLKEHAEAAGTDVRLYINYHLLKKAITQVLTAQLGASPVPC